jgi:hypothetical protein
VKTDINIEKKSFSKDDIDLLIYEILPSQRKSTFRACLIFFLLIPIMPFLPARITHNSLIQRMSFENALLVFTVINGLTIFLIYHLGITLLNRDIDEGYKYCYRTKIIQKVWRGNNEFEMVIKERPKNVNMKFVLNKDLCTNWIENDILEITFLKRTGRVLSFNKTPPAGESVPLVNTKLKNSNKKFS